MGGCATKPKVLKDTAAGAPMPEPQKEQVTAKVQAAKKEEGVGADDEANKRRSLSNLFKENEEKSLEYGKDETSETKQASELSESNPKEMKKPKSAEEQMPAPVIDAPSKIEVKKAQEVASSIEAPKLETSVEEKILNIKPATEGKDEMPEMRTKEKPAEDTQKSETPTEKKTGEKPTTDNQQPEKPRENKTEEAPAAPQIEEKKPPSAQEKMMES